MLRIAIDRLPELFAKMAESKVLYLPIEKNDQVEFYPWNENEKVRLDKLNTLKSAKDLFFPQTENMMKFKLEGKNISIAENRDPVEPFVVFGVRACDVASFEVLDRVFLVEPYDSYYANRREHGLIISMACTRPVETCFCQTFDIDAANPQGDIVCHKTESDVYFKAITEKGNALMTKLDDVTEDADSSEVDAQVEKTHAIMKKLPLANLTTDKFGADKTNEFFDAPEWKELSQSCLGCGTCTFVCPTCQCYDIKDYNTGHGVIRFRCWDSCMYSDFTKMAHGNSRNSQLERFRQRFMHKLVYYPTNNDGLFSCVGCGRCLAKCPISMNIVKVMKTLGGKDHE